MSLQQNERLDYLDAVRGFALILGIVFHTSLSFMPIFIGWAVMDVSTSDVVSVFVLISHSFRMELFFLLAGFFSHMTFHRTGSEAFIRSRLVRIAIPFLIGWFLLRPLLISAWIMGMESMRGEVNIWPALQQGFATLGDIPKDLFVGTHLWFLYYLLLITSAVLTLRYLFSLSSALKHGVTRLADATVNWLCQSRLAIFALVLPTAACLWFMQTWGMDTPDKSLVPHIPVSLAYGGFFLFGWLLHRQPLLIEKFAALTWGKSLLCIAAIVITAMLSQYEMQPGHPDYMVFKATFALSYAVMMWLLVALSIGVCKQVFARRNEVVRYIADASYWLYLIHLPIVIWLQIAVAELPLHWSVKWAIVCLLTLAISLVIYDVFVRNTFVGKVLNGKRKTSVLLKTSNRTQALEG